MEFKNDKLLFNNEIFSNNNITLLEMVSKLENIITDLSTNKDIDNSINLLKTIIIQINNVIESNKICMDKIRIDINDYISNINKNITINVTESFESGDKYIGEMKNEKAEGKGIYYFRGGDKYEGEFKDNKFNGRGIYYYNEGDRYEGNFKDDKREGKGIYYSINNCRYEGDYKNDKREGKGIMYYSDGRYEGDFKNDKKEGQGIYYYNNGDREMGDYFKGKKKGNHVTLHNDGSVSTKSY